MIIFPMEILHVQKRNKKLYIEPENHYWRNTNSKIYKLKHRHHYLAAIELSWNKRKLASQRTNCGTKMENKYQSKYGETDHMNFKVI